MFTGLVTAKGVIVAWHGHNCLEIATGFNELVEGESIAVNGCCLTVVSFSQDRATFDLNPETLELTALSQLKQGQEVNLERALAVGDRLGGHLVSGHVDGCGEVIGLQSYDDCLAYRLQLSPELAKAVVLKGSICIDGVSLTVNKLMRASNGGEVEVMLIPVTLQHTTLGQHIVGQKVHIETDMVVKYLAQLAEPYLQKP